MDRVTEGFRRGTTEVNLPGDVTSAELYGRIKTAVNEQLDGEWAINCESILFVEFNEAANTARFSVTYVAIPGSGPTDETYPRNIPYRPTRFDSKQ